MQSTEKVQRGILEALIHDEIARLERRRERWEEGLRRLEERYPSAASLRVELAPLLERERSFGLRLKEAKKRLAPLKAELRALFEDFSARGERELTLVWRADEGLLSRAERGGAWRRQGGESVDLDGALRELLTDLASAQGVGYPIIFTHQNIEDQRALAYAIGWAFILVSAQELILEEQLLDGMCFEIFERQIELRQGHLLSREEFLEATDFGFSEDGEVWRRIQEFDLADPEAHQLKWLSEMREAAEETRVLRAQSGALLQVEVDRELRRIRLIEQPLSQVIRKRTMVFVEPSPLEVEDFYLAQASELSRSLKGLLRERIEQGYRMIYELLEDEGGSSERGQRPLELLKWSGL